MASYKVEWKRSAQKELRKLAKPVSARVLGAVEDLAENPLPAGVRKLVGTERTYRLRVGDYRIVYSLYETELVVEVVRVRHRRDAYR